MLAYLGALSISRLHPMALTPGPPARASTARHVYWGLRSAQPPRGLEPAGGSPLVLRLGRQLWSPLRVGPVAARGLFPTCAVCRLPASALPFPPSLGLTGFWALPVGDDYPLGRSWPLWAWGISCVRGRGPMGLYHYNFSFWHVMFVGDPFFGFPGSGPWFQSVF